MATAGLDHPTQFAPAHFSRRVSQHEVKSFAELYPPLELIKGNGDKRYEIAQAMASTEELRHASRGVSGAVTEFALKPLCSWHFC